MSGTDPESGEEQSFFSHLIELRERLLKSIAAVLIILVALLPFDKRLYQVIAEPLQSLMPKEFKMVAIEVASPFLTPVKLAFFTALFLAMPILLYQAWSFVAPGLYRHEKRLAVPLLASSVIMFYLGCAFAYFMVLPKVFVFLLSATPEGVAMMTDIGHYLDFVLTMFFAFGLCFEVPVGVFIVALLGWVSPAQLSKHRPYVILGAFILAAIVAPPDMLSMIMLAIPMCLLYEVGLLAVRLFLRSPRSADTPANS
jgi:sec-independent protein translocase protein TatC